MPIPLPPRRPRFLVVLTLLAITAPAAGGLRQQIEQVLRGSDLGGATIGISVRSAGPGSELVAIDAATSLIPASNLKLFTSGAALETLGGDFRFETRMIQDESTIWIVADGDPAFGDPRLLALMGERGLDVDSFLALWTDAIIDSGLTTIETLIVDDRIFDRELVHPSWPIDQLNRRYCAQVSGLSFYLNQIHFFPTPRPGERPSLAVFSPYTRMVSLSNNATSRTGVHDDDTVWVARKLGTNALTFYGNVKHPYRAPVPVTVHDMPMLFGKIIAERLRAAGLSVGTVRLATSSDPDPKGTALGPVIYTPIETVITRCNRDSQNLYAEALLKRMGAAMTGQGGSWLNGAAIVRHVVHRRLGHAGLAARLQIVDGSGMSRENRVAPATVTAWLNSFHNDEKLGAMFIDSLAVPRMEGTLEKRFRDVLLGEVTVRAKSGYINGVSCLSGYITASGGERRCFSIMVNNLDLPVRRKRMQERVVEVIAKDMITVPVTLGGE